MKIGILGAGFAGLSSAWLAKKRGLTPIVIERQDYAGGLARSFNWHGFHCDFAAHRLFTQDEQVLAELFKLTPMHRHYRQSQIYFNSQWMDDPLDVIELAKKTEFKKIQKIVLSFLRRPKNEASISFKTFVVQKYGEGLYEYFFRPYTEKLFGIPGETIALSWAQKKVRLSGPFDRFRRNTKIKFREFYYPIEGGYGAIAQSLHQEVAGQIKFNAKVTGLEKTDGRISGVIYQCDGQEHIEKVDSLISTLPLTVTGQLVGHKAELSYRPVHAVYLLLDKPKLSPNHWIYFMDDDIAINRLVEFKNLSSVGVPQETTVVCAEVTSLNSNVINRVIMDLEKVGLVKKREILESMVISEPFSYPVYDLNYEREVEETRSKIMAYKNLYVVGRAAEFKHREIDDNFASALETVDKICNKVQGSYQAARSSEPNGKLFDLESVEPLATS